MEKKSKKRMSSLEAFHVSPGVWQANAKEKTIVVTSGPKCLELLKKQNHQSLLEKTCRELLTHKWHSDNVSLTWKAKVTKYNLLFYQLAASTPHTGVTESSSSLWSTPTTFDSSNIMKPRKKNKSGGQKPPLCQEVHLWRTPDAASGGSNLPGIQKALDKGHLKRPSGQPIQIRLEDQVKEPRLWPTPSAGMWKQDVNDKGRYAKDIKEKGYQIMLPAEVKLRDSQTTGVLSPMWVAWLLGFPTEWLN